MWKINQIKLIIEKVAKKKVINQILSGQGMITQLIIGEWIRKSIV